MFYQEPCAGCGAHSGKHQGESHCRKQSWLGQDFLRETRDVSNPSGQTGTGYPCQQFPGGKSRGLICISAGKPGFQSDKGQTAADDGRQTVLEKISLRMVFPAHTWKITKNIEDAGGQQYYRQGHKNTLPGSDRLEKFLINLPLHCRSQNETGQHQRKCQQWNQNQPVQEHVCGHSSYQCPCIAGEQAQLGRQVIVVLAQMLDGIRPGGWSFSSRVKFWLNLIYASGTMLPCGQPAAYVSATRYRGKIIKFTQKVFLCQPLQDTESESSAADAASGNA